MLLADAAVLLLEVAWKGGMRGDSGGICNSDKPRDVEVGSGAAAALLLVSAWHGWKVGSMGWTLVHVCAYLQIADECDLRCDPYLGPDVLAAHVDLPACCATYAEHRC